MTILQILDEIASNNSRLHKEAVIKREENNALFKKVVKVALDPKINFFMKVPKATRSLTSETSLMEDGEPGMTLENALDWAVEMFSTREVSGNAAKASFKQIYENDLTPEDAEVFRRIIDKDLRIGCTETTFNKVWGDGFIYVHPNLLCEPIKEKFVEAIFAKGKGAVLQLKSDGGRVNIYVHDDGEVIVYSRSGNPLFVDGRFDWMGQPGLGLRGYVVDGEVLQRDKNAVGGVANRQKSNGILNKLVHGTPTQEELDNMVVQAWDIIPLGNFVGKIRCDEPYKSRLVKLNAIDDFAKEVVPGKNLEVIESRHVDSYGEALVKYKEYIAMGLEGAILKDYDLPWEDDRSALALKMKKIQTCELRVTAVEYGEPGGRNEHRLGGLICESEDGLIKTKIGKGFTDKERDEFIDGSIIGKIVEVEYNSVTKAEGSDTYSLFLESFVQIRIDKTRANFFSEIQQ